MVINIGDTCTTGPIETAYVIDRLIQPSAVIASHTNEEATEARVYVPLSGQTIAFDADGKCMDGCTAE